MRILLSIARQSTINYDVRYYNLYIGIKPVPFIPILQKQLSDRNITPFLSYEVSLFPMLNLLSKYHPFCGYNVSCCILYLTYRKVSSRWFVWGYALLMLYITWYNWYEFVDCFYWSRELSMKVKRFIILQIGMFVRSKN